MKQILPKSTHIRFYHGIIHRGLCPATMYECALCEHNTIKAVCNNLSGNNLKAWAKEQLERCTEEELLEALLW